MDIYCGDRFPGVGSCHHRQVAGAGGSSGRGLDLLLVRGHHWRHGYRHPPVVPELWSAGRLWYEPRLCFISQHSHPLFLN